MPGENLDYITQKNKDVCINEHNALEQVNVPKQASAYANFMSNGQQLKKDTRTNLVGKKITDSELMIKVKENLKALNLYYEKPIPKDMKWFKYELNILDEHYHNLIISAHNYINAKTNLWKKIYYGQGYERLEMVKKISDQAQIDRARLKSRARDIFEFTKGKEERPLWANVLADVRTERLDIEIGKDVKYVTHKDETKIGEVKKGEAIVGVVKIKSQESDRDVLNYRIAQLLGIEHMVQASRHTIIYYGKVEQGKEDHGVILENVIGNNISEETNKITKGILLQMNSAEIFDIITGQTSRNKDNILVTSTGIKLINNENSFGLQDYKSILTAKGIESNLDFNLVDSTFAYRIMALSDQVIDFVTKDLLTKEEIKALKNRLHGVQKWLEANVTKNKFVWNNMYRADKGKFSEQHSTYLNKYISEEKIKQS